MVVEARHRREGRSFAIKMIRSPSLRLNSDGRRESPYAASLQREVEMLSQLSHPHICKMERSYLEDGRLGAGTETVEAGGGQTH